MMLEGIRIIDFSQYIPGSYASQRLAELGAEVIKVEPLTGSPTRLFGKEIGAEGIIFSAYNRGKKSITLNLKDKSGQKIALELIRNSDIVIESYRSGVMEKFNLDYEQVRKVKEDIIYLSLTGYGQTGILSEYGSHDLNYLSLGGILSQTKDKKGKPILPSMTFADIIGGMSASERIMSALWYREKTGKGQYIDIALMNEIINLVDSNLFTQQHIGMDNVIAQLDGEIISYNIYETKDGRYVSLAALEQKYWNNFCEAVNQPEWIDSHLTTKNEDNSVYQEVERLFLSQSLEEWTRFSLEVDCCLTPILEISELETHPYISEHELIRFDNVAPKVGEHTEMILYDILNFGKEEIEKLRANKVI